MGDDQCAFGIRDRGEMKEGYMRYLNKAVVIRTPIARLVSEVILPGAFVSD